MAETKMDQIGIFDEIFPENGIFDEKKIKGIESALTASGFTRMETMEPFMWFHKEEIEIHITRDGNAYSPTIGIIPLDAIKSL